MGKKCVHLGRTRTTRILKSGEPGDRTYNIAEQFMDVEASDETDTSQPVLCIMPGSVGRVDSS
jgi:hypothetical protein